VFRQAAALGTILRLGAFSGTVCIPNTYLRIVDFIW